MRRTIIAALVCAACGASSAPIGPTLPAPSAGPAMPPAPTLPPQPPDLAAWRSEMPGAGPAGQFKPPSIVGIALRNGLPVYLVHNRALPIVVVRLVVRGGGAANPAGKPGLAALTANLLDEGAGRRGALELADATADLGAQLATGADADHSWVTIDTLKDKLGPALDLLADVTLRPRFEPKELDRVKNDVSEELRRQRDSGPTIAANVLRMAVYGENHPYAYPDLGTEAALAGITQADVLAYYKTYWQPQNAALIVVGDLTVEEARAALEPRFGGWKPGKEARPAPMPPAAPDAGPRRVILVDRPGAKQGDVAIGHRGPQRGVNDWYALEIAARALGGMFSSRINMNVREAKGYTYGARARFTPMVGDGQLLAGGGMVPEKTAAAVAEIVKEIANLRTHPPDAAELGKAKDAATLGLTGQLESNAQIAAAVDDIVVYHLPQNYFEVYMGTVQALTPEAAAAAAQKYLLPEHLITVVVGTAAMEKDLAALGLGPVERRDATGALVK